MMLALLQQHRAYITKGDSKSGQDCQGFLKTVDAFSHYLKKTFILWHGCPTSKAETRIRIRLSIRVRIPELLQARTYAIPYVKEPAGQRDVYGQSGCCPVRFRNTCMFGITHAARFQHE